MAVKEKESPKTGSNLSEATLALMIVLLMLPMTAICLKAAITILTAQTNQPLQCDDRRIQNSGRNPTKPTEQFNSYSTY